MQNGNLNYPRQACPLAPKMCCRKKGLFPRNGDLGMVPLHERVRRYPKLAFRWAKKLRSIIRIKFSTASEEFTAA